MSGTDPAERTGTVERNKATVRALVEQAMRRPPRTCEEFNGSERWRRGPG